jgi:hypothetical protein
LDKNEEGIYVVYISLYHPGIEDFISPCTTGLAAGVQLGSNCISIERMQRLASGAMNVYH